MKAKALNLLEWSFEKHEKRVTKGQASSRLDGNETALDMGLVYALGGRLATPRPGAGFHSACWISFSTTTGTVLTAGRQDERMGADPHESTKRKT